MWRNYLARLKVRSRLRNPIIGTVLRDLPGGYMERVGSGIRYMRDQMRKLGRPEPRFKEQGEIRVIFSNVPLSAESSSRIEPFLSDQSPLNKDEEENLPFPSWEQDSRKEERQQEALRYVHEHGSITNKEYRTVTGASENTALRDLDDLVERGSLRALGKRRARHYKLP